MIFLLLFLYFFYACRGVKLKMDLEPVPSPLPLPRFTLFRHHGTMFERTTVEARLKRCRRNEKRISHVFARLVTAFSSPSRHFFPSASARSVSRTFFSSPHSCLFSHVFSPQQSGRRRSRRRLVLVVSSGEGRERRTRQPRAADSRRKETAFTV